MKNLLLLLIQFYAIYKVEKADSVKLNKTFDEIFGKGWDAEVPEFTETKEWHKMETQTTEVENKSTDQPNRNEQNFSDHYESFVNRKIKERFDEIYDENWSEDDNELIEEDEAVSTDQNDCIVGQKCQKVQENGTKLINVYSDQQKREIVEEFIKMKNEYKQKGKHSRKEWNYKYTQIAKSIGVSLRAIKKWKKEFGLTHKLQSDKVKKEKLKEYCEIKGNNPRIKDLEIAESLNIGRRTLKQWKMELKNAVKDEKDCSLQMELNQITQLNVYSDQQKRQILQQFDEIKSKCKKAKLKNISMHELDNKIAKKLGVCVRTIIRWKREFCISVSNKISDATKIGILKKYAKIKEKNPKMRDCDIADLLKISISSLRNWKKQFKDEIKKI